MRDKALYRENLSQIKERFGDLELIPARKVADYLGIDVRTALKTLPNKKVSSRYFITASDLARWLS